MAAHEPHRRGRSHRTSGASAARPTAAYRRHRWHPGSRRRATNLSARSPARRAGRAAAGPQQQRSERVARDRCSQGRCLANVPTRRGMAGRSRPAAGLAQRRAQVRPGRQRPRPPLARLPSCRKRACWAPGAPRRRREHRASWAGMARSGVIPRRFAMRVAWWAVRRCRRSAGSRTTRSRRRRTGSSVRPGSTNCSPVPHQATKERQWHGPERCEGRSQRSRHHRWSPIPARSEQPRRSTRAAARAAGRPTARQRPRSHSARRMRRDQARPAAGSKPARPLSLGP